MPVAKPQTARDEREGVLYSVLAAASGATIVVTAKLAYANGVNVVTLLAIRFTLGTVALWLLARHRGVARVARRDALLALTLGGVMLSLNTALAFTALARLDASLVELLLFSYPAVVVLAAIILRRERASRRHLSALALASGGVALVLLGNNGGAFELLGATLALAAAVMWAAYVLVAASVARRLHPLTFTALVSAGAAGTLVGAGVVTGSLRLALSPVGWACVAAVAFTHGVIALSAFLAGAARLGPSRASILAMLEPPIACLLAFLAFGERLTPLQLLGGALVTSAAIALQMRPLRSAGRGAAALPSDHAAARALAGDAP